MGEPVAFFMLKTKHRWTIITISNFFITLKHIKQHFNHIYSAGITHSNRNKAHLLTIFFIYAICCQLYFYE